MPLSASRPLNPYWTDADPGSTFVGQRELLRFVEAEFRSPERSAVLLCGGRRAGKTAVLLHLQRSLPSPPLLPVYLDLRERAHSPLGRVLYELAAALGHEVNLTVDADSFDDQGHHFQREFLPLLYAALPAGYRPLLLLDDIDALDAVADRLPEGVSGRTFLPLLGKLLVEEPRLGFLLTSARRRSELSAETRALLKDARDCTVPLLDEEGARELLALGETQGLLRSGTGAAARALALSGGEPYLLRVLLQQVLELADPAAAGDPAPGGAPSDPIPVIDAAAVEAAAERAQKAAAPYLEDRYRDLSVAERIVVSALATAMTETPGGVVASEGLPAILQGQGVRMMTHEMELAPEALCARDLLRRSPGGLGFRAELWRRHLAQGHPVAGLRGELQQLVPAASALYEQAQKRRGEGALTEVQELLERTLRLNPNHSGARRLLGQVLVEQGRLEDACRELEEASRAGDEAARLALLRALLDLGEEHERSAEEERALQAYDRALLLSPGNAVAQERRSALYTTRADRAYALGDNDGARALYEQAGRLDRVAATEERTKNTELRRLTTEAAKYESESDWERAQALYQKLAADEPARWQEALDRTQKEARLRQCQIEGQEALARGDWERAARSLAEAVRLRPGNKELAALLRRAEQEHEKSLRIDRAGSGGHFLRAVPLWAWVLVLAGFGGAVGFGSWLRQHGEHGGARSSSEPPLLSSPSSPSLSSSMSSSAQQRPGGTATGPVVAGPLVPRLRVEPGWGQAAGREVATAALALAEDGKWRDALDKFQDADRMDPHPGWLYDLGVVHDQLGECDDAGFFYRAALFGKGVSAADRPLVERRVDFLDEQCQFKRRQTSAADRHARASRFMGLKLCALAESVLTGIATPAEVAAIEQCLGRAVAPGVALSTQKSAHGRAQALPQPLFNGPAAGAGPGSGQGTGPALLTVTVTPAATVFLDGVRLGAAPLLGQKIRPGTHTVLLVNDELGKRQTYSIKASAGTTYNITYKWVMKP